MFFVDNQQKANFTMQYSFPLVVHETDLRDKPMGTNTWHWHEELQFSYVLDGEMVLTACGNSTTLRSGDAVFLNTEVEHMSCASAPDYARYLSLNVQPSLLTLFHGSIIEQKYFLPYVNDPQLQLLLFRNDSEEARPFLDNLLTLFRLLREMPFGYEIEAHSILLRLWRRILGYAEKSVPYEHSERYEAREMLNFIQTHFRDRLMLDDIARQVHISKGECCRLFRQSYGCSIFTYLTDYRMHQSIRMLAERKLSVSEIAEQCGFNSTSYFIKTFREKVGMTPLQYRRTTYAQEGTDTSHFDWS